ncbi:MAG: pilus assembly protein PilM, partial [Deltaproteobacteria bacterium]|nr:pilus assembly protein PilM [Deltaproteobacteria bacterium]
LKGPEIDRIAFIDVKGPKNLAQELKEFFRSEDLRDEILITCLPTSLAVIRQIPPSLDNVKKLNKIIKYQMEPYVPYPIEDVVVDFLPPEPGEDILTIGVQKKFLSEHLESLSRAGLEPDVVGLDDLALFSLYVQSHEGNSDQPVSIINLGVQKMTVQMIYQNRLDFIRVLPDGTNNLEQLLETIELYQIKKPDLTLGQILLTGHGVTSGDMAKKLSLHTKIKTSIWRPFDEIKHQFGDMETDLQARLSVPLGLALGMANTATKGFDLRKEDFAINKSMNLKRMFTYMLSATLILIGLFSFNIYHNVFTQEERYQKLSKEVRQIFKDTFPEIKNIVKGREAAQMHQMIEEQTAKYRWLEDFTGEGAVLNVLEVLTKTLLIFSDVRMDNLTVEGKEIRLNGRSSSFETVDRLKEKLTTSGFFDKTKLVGAKMDNREKTVKFNFALEMKK